MFKSIKIFVLAAGAALLAACGSNSTTTSQSSSSTLHGTLSVNPPFRIASLDAAAFQANLAATTSGAQLLQITGNPKCGVDFYYVRFWTLGGAGETTESSAALMVPTGSAPCSGPRPIVLYAHGTNTDKTLNIADITNPANSEGVLIAAMFAAQGYTVVAPNYAGYDISTLGYHPYLNAQQQSGEMMDALSAARTALPSTLASATTDSGKLFITGYSQGGYVAMATQRAMQAAGSTVSGAAPMSGPYALEAFGDALFLGNVNLGSTVFAPLIGTSYQRAYHNLYSTPGDLYSATYANGIEGLLPSATPLDQIFSQGLLPQLALFNSTTPMVTVPNNPALSAQLTALLLVPSDPNYPLPPSPQTPLFAAGFGSPYLINNSYRVAYVLDAASNPDGALPVPGPGVPLAAVLPTQPLRQDFYKNDLRNGPWAPASPTLLCGGNADPTVFFSVNTGTMAAFWSPLVQAKLITVLDVSAAPAGPFAALQSGFQASQAAQLLFYESAAGGALTPAAAALLLTEGYHTAVAPFCALAARDFFSQL